MTRLNEAGFKEIFLYNGKEGEESWLSKKKKKKPGLKSLS